MLNCIEKHSWINQPAQVNGRGAGSSQPASAGAAEGPLGADPGWGHYLSSFSSAWTFSAWYLCSSFFTRDRYSCAHFFSTSSF